MRKSFLIVLTMLAFIPLAHSQPASAQDYKSQVIKDVDSMTKEAQVMVDTVFSFGELGFQEVETSRYLTGVLEKEGFKIERGISGIPTAWMASWGSGKPVIALGSDIDCIPQASQKPGVAYHDPLIEGAPGHGEGHNSGVPLNILAAIAVKRQMERNKMAGTIKVWPGVAEELVAGKAYFVRDGYFKDVDVVLFTHVGNNLSVTAGPASATGLVSVEYNFKGESAHAGRGPLARAERSGRGRINGYWLELSARASAHPAEISLCDHQRWGSAECRAANCKCLVLLPRTRLRTHY